MTFLMDQQSKLTPEVFTQSTKTIFAFALPSLMDSLQQVSL